MYYPIEFDLDLLIVILKTARVARLIPSSTVVELSSRINFYWYYERLCPTWYWHKFLEKREQVRRMTEENTTNGLHGVRRISWGGLELAALAAVKAKAREAQIKKQLKGNPFKRAMRKGMKAFGLLPNSKYVELRRHIAATKIQRAWRNTLSRPTEAQSDDELGAASMDDDDVAWKGRSAPTSALERVLKKRSMLGRYQQQNCKNIRKTGCSGEEKPSLTSGRNAMSKKLSIPDKEVRPESQVGSAMGELTGQRVATGILFSLVLTILFTYQEADATKASTMVVLHGQIVDSPSEAFAERALNAARYDSKSLQDMFSYYGGSDDRFFHFDSKEQVGELREREKLKITVEDSRGTTDAYFVYRQERKNEARVELIATFFVLLIWFLGVTLFAGPVMTLVIIPIERMVRLLGMLVLDPLGYQSTSRFKKFLVEEDALIKKSQWTKEVLKGMETSFLMSTILRIGSLMKVGFGSAGVEIIRNYLQIGQNKNQLHLNSQGVTVACIFLFCDIRQFTDATECLQEEVFVFTNRIAAVVHSICHSYGGSANKNVGDAFLVSWLLEDEGANAGTRFNPRSSQALSAKHNQADKALLSVVRICMALQYDNYYVETMSPNAREKLLTKLKKRPGPVVQMGFGLHAGKAAQCAIGSQRKIDATYVSEAVERAEFLESSTKQYGLKMLMSDSFHRLLHPSNRRRCRKIDQIIFHNEDEDGDDEAAYAKGDIMELFTYDMEIEALWRTNTRTGWAGEIIDDVSDTESVTGRGGKKDSHGKGPPTTTRGSGALRKKTLRLGKRRSDENKASINSISDELRSGHLSATFEVGAATATNATPDVGSAQLTMDKLEENKQTGPGELVLPSGPALYSNNVWLQEDMRRIRHQYTHVIFQKFNSGMQAYYQKDWVAARECFEAVLERFEDGPSRYFVNEIEKYNGTPPRDFLGYGRA
jgi:class 3 adenylate cyclase